MERGTLDRSKRVRILKRLIVCTVLGLILLPTALCVCLFVRCAGLNRELKELQDAHLTDESRINQLEKQLDAEQKTRQEKIEEIISLTEQLEQESRKEPEEAETEPEKWPRKVYLTFDDGPSGHTQDILDILDRYGVKGNFFVCATKNEEYQKYYRIILEQGHMLGLHSYSHVYDDIYASQDAFEEDVLKIREFVSEQTDGYQAVYYRFPGGSSNLSARISLNECEKWLTQQGIVYYDWNISAQDAVNPMQSTEAILHNATSGCEDYEEVVILMHDLGNKDSTVEALPGIIEYYQGIGAQISVIDENSMRIQHDK